MIELLDLELENFLGWRHGKFQLDGRGVTYVTGPNGSGKSSLPAALLWCLTGRSDRVERSEDLVCQGGRFGDTTVQLGCRIRAHTLRIIRRRGVRSNSHALELSVDGQDVSARHLRPAQDEVSHWVGFPHEQLQQFLVFSQYFFTSLAEADQKSLLCEIFKFTKFGKAGDWIGERSKVLTSKMTAAHFHQVRWEGECDAHAKLLAAEKLAYQKAKAVTVVRAEELRQERERLEQRREELQDQVSVLRTRESELRELTFSLAANVRELDSVNSRIDAVRATGAICPTCQQELPAARVRDTLRDLRTSKRRLMACIVALESEIDGLRGVDLQKEIVDAIRGLNTTERELGSCRTALRAVGQDAQSLRRRIRGLRELLARHTQTARAAQQKVERYEQRLQYYDWWSRGFNSRGIETEALRTVLPYVNSRVNATLQSLPTRDRGCLEFGATIDHDRLRCPIRYSGGQHYAGLSGGERRRLDFAIAYALQTFLANQFNVWFLDEPFENLDLLGVQQCLQVLKDSNRSSIFVMSHRQDLQGLFNTVWTLSSKKGYSQLVSQEEQTQDVLVA